MAALQICLQAAHLDLSASCVTPECAVISCFIIWMWVLFPYSCWECELLLDLTASWYLTHEPEDAWSGYRSEGALPLHLTGRSEQESRGQTGKSQHQAVRLTWPFCTVKQCLLCFYWMFFYLGRICFMGHICLQLSSFHLSQSSFIYQNDQPCSL